ncbi:serine hydrolase [Rufibacter quisquiliarum]|uniref:beta-lactamase n=1 Tax=Rufibacter quisquiliarum TaxID=1549639 RepID=A0A839GWZ2_9BACT|nr:serine hydrolase [Rufibacter quisquiliarum]MBA9079377.1 beta-lactamase class A [Rufibacter quisquiliarum]
MRLPLLMFLVCFLLHFTTSAQQTRKEDIDKKLTQKLEALANGFQGDVGIYVRHLKTGKMVAINADTLFPTASMIKIPIMVGMFDKMERGEIDSKTVLRYRDSLYYAGEDIVGNFKDSSLVALSKVQMLSITTSDNTGSLWLQQLAGGGEAINAWLEKNGFQHTRMNSRTPGRRPNWVKYGWGQTTPREMATLVTMIRDGKAVSPAASERMYRNLGRIYYDREALSQIPPYVHTASKSGAVNQSKSEVVLVNAPHGDYVFCIITKNQQDERWQDDNAGYVLIRKVSNIIWNHFEPKYYWEPAAGVEKY